MAEIVVHRHYHPFYEVETFTYEWVGGLNEEVELPDVVDIAKIPFPLEVKRDCYPLCPAKIYVRLDTQFPWYAVHRVIKLKDSINNQILLMRTKIILTLVVWGVGQVIPGERVGWHCLRR